MKVKVESNVETIPGSECIQSFYKLFDHLKYLKFFKVTFDQQNLFYDCNVYKSLFS